MNKNKKTYLLFSAIIQIAILVYYIYSISIGGEEIIGASTTQGIILFSICSILGVALLIVTLFKSKNKKSLIIISILMALTGTIETLILSIINIIVLTRKTEEEKKMGVKEKKKIELPKLEEINISKIRLILGIALLILYATQLFSYLILKIMPDDNIFLARIIFIIIELIFFIAVIYVFYPTLKRDFKAFKSNFKTYMKYIKGKIGIFYLIYFSISIPLLLIVGENSTNQQGLEELPIWFSIPMACIYAPLIEEILFRGFLKNAIKNKTIYIIISGLIFGLVHIIGLEHISWTQYLYIILYGYMGVYFAYIYQKTDNIFTSMTFHFIQNLIGAIFLVLGFFIQ